MTGSTKRGRPAGSVAIFDPQEDGTLIGGVVVLLACSRGLPLEGAPALFAGQASLLRRLADALDALGGDPEPVADARMGGAS